MDVAKLAAVCSLQKVCSSVSELVLGYLIYGLFGLVELLYEVGTDDDEKMQKFQEENHHEEIH